MQKFGEELRLPSIRLGGLLRSLPSGLEKALVVAYVWRLEVAFTMCEGKDDPVFLYMSGKGALEETECARDAEARESENIGKRPNPLKSQRKRVGSANDVVLI
eukprot:122512-Amphidinium_carterae.1